MVIIIRLRTDRSASMWKQTIAMTAPLQCNPITICIDSKKNRLMSTMIYKESFCCHGCTLQINNKIMNAAGSCKLARWYSVALPLKHGKTTRICLDYIVSFMAALCNRAGHIYFHPIVCSSFFLLFSFLA